MDFYSKIQHAMTIVIVRVVCSVIMTTDVVLVVNAIFAMMASMAIAEPATQQ